LKQASEAQGLYSEAERRLYEEGFDPKWEEYLDLSFEFLSLSADDDSEGAVALLNGEAREVYEDFSSDLQELVRVNNTNSIEAAERAERTFNKARSLTLTLLITTLVLSAAIAFALVRLISVPVRQLERAAHTVAEGDLDVRLDIDSKDEIGSLARSFEQMAASLRRAQQQLVMKEKMASLGNLVAGVAHEINSRVTPGSCPPGVPTDPYVRTLAHTVPQITNSLRDHKQSAPREAEARDNAPLTDGSNPSV
jgi:HAMP domain-containing protein